MLARLLTNEHHLYVMRRFSHQTCVAHITPPPSRAWRNFKLFFGVRCIRTAHKLVRLALPYEPKPTHPVNSFLAEYLNKTHILTYILKHLSVKKILRFLCKNSHPIFFLKRAILTANRTATRRFFIQNLPPEKFYNDKF